MSLEEKTQALSLADKPEAAAADADTAAEAPAEAPEAPQPEPKEEDIDVDPTKLDNTLDSLLFAYCDLLDEYQSAQASLKKHLTDGYLSLAQANYSAKNRYGQDMYHGNMEAARVFCAVDKTFTPLFTKSEHAFVEFSTAPYPAETEAKDTKATKDAAAPAADVAIKTVDGPTTTATEAPAVRQRKTKSGAVDEDAADDTVANEKAADAETPDGADESEPAEPTEEEKAAEAKRIQEERAKRRKERALALRRDPIRWFGVLVPQALRDSQARFTDATDAIAAVLTVRSKLAALETAIDKARA
ncbi:uncharacterized protein V1510DRAFT_430746 [Dipodascopsis tothii]|uniref:uncharacterized protein n=1 Tax=Dipodascopsis tothii TaxID=44089 RepID=UPI0034CFF9D0